MAVSTFPRFTAPMFGYSCWQEYYGAARLADKLTSIKVLFSHKVSHEVLNQVPTLALNALDDPFQPGDSIPFESAARWISEKEFNFLL